MCPYAQINDQMSDGDEDFHVFFEDVCDSVCVSTVCFLSKKQFIKQKKTFQADQPHVPPFIW